MHAKHAAKTQSQVIKGDGVNRVLTLPGFSITALKLFKPNINSCLPKGEFAFFKSRHTAKES